MTIDAPQAPVVPVPDPVPQRHDLAFTGSGSEYFRIWIVNVLLTLVTLGIYSAWAKVRTQQYFHRNIVLAGSSFDYHARPLTILKGRVIALVLFGAYVAATRTSGIATLVVLALAAVVMPWLLWRSLRFRLSVTSYRGLRFGFSGTLGAAYRVFLLWPVLTAFTLYLLAPFTHRAIKAYQHNGSRYGGTPFSFDGKTRSFYGVYLTCVVPTIVIAAALAVLTFSIARGTSNEGYAALVPVFLMYAIIFIVLPIFKVRLRNLIWNHTRLGEHRIVSEASVLRYLGIQLGNYLLIILTLGLFIPFARVRSVRYLASATALVAAGSLDDFVSGQTDASVGAAGDETADTFGIDIAL